MQTTNSILLIRPNCFQYNAETENTNLFQQQLADNKENITKKAIEEFNIFAQLLINNGIDVIIINDTPKPEKPDAVFPNNWISFHENGKIILYPMMAENRRVERRYDIIEQLEHQFFVNQIKDLSHFEQEFKYLEGTGSVVFDRINKKAFACLSPRTNKEILYKLCDEIEYQPVCFQALDDNGNEIYHTNVMMCLGTYFAVVCLATIKDEQDKKNLIDELEKSKKEIIDIDVEQMKNFAGNMLELQDNKGKALIVLSQTALICLKTNQLNTLKKYGELLPLNVSTIEKIGGGSVRCMIAEIFLNKK
jgi:hypothetical protein